MELAIDVEMTAEPCAYISEVQKCVRDLTGTTFYEHKKLPLWKFIGKNELVNDLVKQIIAKGVDENLQAMLLTDIPFVERSNVVNINVKSHKRSHKRYMAIEFEYRGKVIRGVTCHYFDRWGIQKNGEWVYYRNFIAAIK